MTNWEKRRLWATIRQVIAWGFALLILLIVMQFAFIASGQAASGVRAIEKMVGLHERKNTRSLQRRIKVNPRRIPWCGALMCYSLRVEGKKCPRHHLSARAWESDGEAVSRWNVGRGHIVTFRSRAAGSGRHVGQVSRRKGNRVLVVSGNQKNRVNRKWYRIASIVRVRKY